MIVLTPNILPGVLVWAIDIYVFLACIRLVLPKLTRAAWAARFVDGLKPFTDPLPEAVERYLGKRSAGPVPSWLPWLIVIGIALLLEQVIVLTVARAL